jgi:hypothetical protein
LGGGVGGPELKAGEACARRNQDNLLLLAQAGTNFQAFDIVIGLSAVDSSGISAVISLSTSDLLTRFPGLYLCGAEFAIYAVYWRGFGLPQSGSMSAAKSGPYPQLAIVRIKSIVHRGCGHGRMPDCYRKLMKV